MLRNEIRNWIKEKVMLLNHIRNFYKSLFQEDLEDRSSWITKNSFLLINDKQNKLLIEKVTNLEIRKAMLSIGGSKAPRIDGIPASFYQHNWHIVGVDVCNFIKEVFNGRKLEDVNKMLLCLILKKDKLEFINQCHPISLCDVIYKCATKIKERLQYTTDTMV